jgi:hypothetical protein
MNGCGDRDFKWRCIRSGLVSLIWRTPRNQANDRGVNVLRRKDETKNKKKIPEPETETKTSELFSDFQPVLLTGRSNLILLFH